MTHLSAVHITNDADRLLQDEQFTYVYDANGNLVSQTEIATGAVTSYLWDAQDQLIGIAQPDGATVAYAYDALGRRSAKLIGAVRELYAYDGQDIYLEVDEANTVQARYAHGDRVDNPIAFERAGAEYYYHTDHQGSVRQVTDATGVVVNQYAYDSYGQFLERVETVAQLYGYTAREQDAESPLYYYRSRYYDPRTGRFTQEDRIGFDGNDINIYRYVGSNPVNAIDPEGQFANFVVGALIGGIVEAATIAAEGGDPFAPENRGRLGRAAALGAISGGVGGGVARAITNGLARNTILRNSAGRLIGDTLGSGVGTATADVFDQLTDNCAGPVDLRRTAREAAIGAGFGAVSSSVGEGLRARAIASDRARGILDPNGNLDIRSSGGMAKIGNPNRGSTSAAIGSAGTTAALSSIRNASSAGE